jgi:hypothetical protein
MMNLPTDRMPEAEVALRLAFYLVGRPGSSGHADVAIDGASVRIHRSEVFPIHGFMQEHGWSLVSQHGKNDWHGAYRKQSSGIHIHSRSGIGDVVTTIGTTRVRAECKKGPLVKKPGNPEYRLLRETIGQLMTIEEVATNDRLVVAVPNTANFAKLCTSWQQRPLVKLAGIKFALVSRSGAVDGFAISGPSSTSPL